MSAASLLLVTRLAMGDSDKTYFIPLTLSREVPQPPYAKDDPVIQAYQKFAQDLPLQGEVQCESIQFASHIIKYTNQALAKLGDNTVKVFEKDRDKFGNNMGCSITWLWFQYPGSPPPKYEQSGLVISRDSIQWTTREIHPFYSYRLMLAAWPEWMFNSLRTSFASVITTIRNEIKATDEEAEEDSKGNKITPIFTIPHPELTGKVAFHETIGNLPTTLRRTPTGKHPPPPPRGHVRVTGIVQITGEKMLIHVDVDATFDPTKPDHFIFYHMKVRYVAYSVKHGKRTETAPNSQSQESASRLRQQPTPAVTEKGDEDLLEGAKAVLQEAARTARLQSGERTTRAGSNAITAVRESQDAEIVPTAAAENSLEAGKEQVTTPEDHAPISLRQADPSREQEEMRKPKKEISSPRTLPEDSAQAETHQHDGEAVSEQPMGGALGTQPRPPLSKPESDP